MLFKCIADKRQMNYEREIVKNIRFTMENYFYYFLSSRQIFHGLCKVCDDELMSVPRKIFTK